MTDSLPPKPIRASRISLAQMMQPEHANNLGNVHGGWIMKLVDEAGALACMRHAQRRVVTVAIDSMVFRHPIKTSDLVILNSEVSYTGRTSIEAEVQVIAENPITGQRWHTNTAYLGKPIQVPPVFAETVDEEKKLAEAKTRQTRRLEQRK
jgi:acyl-CoA hydrolase